MMKQCKFQKMAHLYPFGAILPAEKMNFEAHVSGCAECAAIVRESEGIRNACAAQPPVRPRHGMEGRILHALRKESRRSAKGFGGNFFNDFCWKLIPAAACLAIILLGTVLLTTPDFTGGDGSDSAVEAAGQSYSTVSNYYLCNKFSERERNLVSDNDDVAYETYYLSLAKN